MKKVVVHIGLAKTATTTLQHDLFQRLHEEGRINFLGKTVDYDLKTGKATWINQSGHLIRKACEGKTPMPTSVMIDQLLSDDKVNIYSDEGLSVYYPGSKNLSLEEKIKRLKSILAEHDVRVVISLRNPIEYMYSLYVQLYPDFFFDIPKFDSFEKYAAYFLKNQSHPMFESLDFHGFLTVISRYFKLRVMIYEDLKYNPDLFYNQLKDAFLLGPHQVRHYLTNQHRNKKIVRTEGAPKLRSYHNIAKRASRLAPRNSIIFKTMKFIYNLPLFDLKRRLSTKRELKSTHKKPSGNLKNQLDKALLLGDDFDFEKYDVDKTALNTYGYIFKLKAD